jgi:hypothetical protein
VFPKENHLILGTCDAHRGSSPTLSPKAHAELEAGLRSAVERPSVYLGSFVQHIDADEVTAPSPWLAQVYSYVKVGGIDDALDLICGHFDAVFDAGKFEDCDAELRSVDVTRLEENTLVGFLSFTLPAADKLPSRKDLFDRIEMQLYRLSCDRVKALLSGLA